MLRRFLFGAMVLSLASIAWAGVPDLNVSTATIPGGAAGASMYVVPNGTGLAFTNAMPPGGGSVDATITLTLIDTNGDEIFGYPFEDLWLETSGGGLVFCAGGTVADASTDIDGMTTWTVAPLAGGNSNGETTQVMVGGAPLGGAGLNLLFKSADLTGDLVVNISDIAAFTPLLDTTAFDGDLTNDGIVNISDIARFTQALDAACN